MKMIPRAALALAAALALVLCACWPIGSGYDTDTVRVYNDTSREVFYQYYYKARLGSGAPLAYTPEGGAVIPPGGSVEFDYTDREHNGPYYVVEKLLLVDAASHRLLRRLDSAEYYAALVHQEPVVDTASDPGTEITQHYYDLRLTEAVFLQTGQ